MSKAPNWSRQEKKRREAYAATAMSLTKYDSVDGDEFAIRPPSDFSDDDDGNGDTTASSSSSSGPKSLCTKKHLLRKLPVVGWVQRYSVRTAVADCIAGLTVGLTVIPQGIALALLAQLPPQYGLYSGFMACFVYAVLGSCKDVTVGPTGIMTLMTMTHSARHPGYAPLLTFFAGIIITLCGVFHLGFLIDFVSLPVIAGFTSAAALTIISTQMRALLGLKVVHQSGYGGFVGAWWDVYLNFDTFRLADAILGCSCIVMLLLLKQLGRSNCLKPKTPVDAVAAAVALEKDPENASVVPTMEPSKKCRLHPILRRALSSTMWFVSTARNAIIVIVCAFLAFLLDDADSNSTKNPRSGVFVLTGVTERGLPPFELPPFEVNVTNKLTNGTVEIVVDDFGAMVSNLGSAIAMVPLVSILEHIAIAKAFSGGRHVAASQELLALGLCNFVSAFVSSMPVTASFGRTAVNAASGVRTPLGSLHTAALVLLALAFLLPSCAFIPKAALAAVLQTAVLTMIEFNMIMPMWRAKKSDLIPGLVTFFACLFWAVDYGIILGIALNLCFVLANAARPSVTAEVRRVDGKSGAEYVVLSVDRGLLFPSAAHLLNAVNKTAYKFPAMPIVLDMSKIATTDFTVAHGLKSTLHDFKKRQQSLILYKMSPSVEQSITGLTRSKAGLSSAASQSELLSLLRTGAGSGGSSEQSAGNDNAAHSDDCETGANGHLPQAIERAHKEDA